MGRSTATLSEQFRNTLTRRPMLRSFANGFGMLGLAGLFEQAARGISWRHRFREPVRRPLAAPCSTCKQYHIPVYVRRTLACRTLRPHAAADLGQRQAIAVREAETGTHKDGQSAGIAVDLSTLRPMRHRGERTVAPHGKVRGRSVRHPLDGGGQTLTTNGSRTAIPAATIG